MSDTPTAWMRDDGRPTRRYVVTGPTRVNNASEVLLDPGIPKIGSKWKDDNGELPLVCCELRVRPLRDDGSFWEVTAVYQLPTDEAPTNEQPIVD